MCENEQKPDLKAEQRKKRAPEAESCPWKEEFQIRSCVLFYDGSAALVLNLEIYDF